MFETGIRQFRMAMAMVSGRRINPQLIQRLVADADATLREFGSPGDDVDQLLDGPFADAETRTHFQTQGIRRTTRRLAAQSPFYAARFEAAGLDPRKPDLDAITAVPPTVKADLVASAGDFLCRDAHPYLSTRTTGTTGKPAEIWLSRYEMELWPALGAISGLIRGELMPDDMLQVNVSSRATGSVHLNTAGCRLVGAACRVLGIVPPDEALDSLAERGATQLATVPSYLAELEVAARRRGMSPKDFRLRRIDVGGEILSTSLARGARETFGAEVRDLFAMTEVIPVIGRPCGDGHLHFDLNTGLVEYLDLDTGEPAEPGALATVVVTPYFPYRDCMPVFRYDTRDVVRCLPAEPLTCEVAGVPGTGLIEGKADQLLRLGPTEVVTPRQLVEAIEALPTRPWPARFRATVHNGRVRLTMAVSAIADLDEAEVARHFADRGLDPDLALVGDEEAIALRPLRSDLHETTFAARPALIGSLT